MRTTRQLSGTVQTALSGRWVRGTAEKIGSCKNSFFHNFVVEIPLATLGRENGCNNLAVFTLAHNRRLRIAPVNHVPDGPRRIKICGKPTNILIVDKRYNCLNYKVETVVLNCG